METSDKDPFGGAELIFPLDCQYRIIAEDIPNIHFVIETVLIGLGVTTPLKFGQFSSKGKYITFSVDVKILSREMMYEIDAQLRQIQGVRMVL